MSGGGGVGVRECQGGGGGSGSEGVCQGGSESGRK